MSCLEEMTALVAVASAGIAFCCLVICIGFLCLRRFVNVVKYQQTV